MLNKHDAESIRQIGRAVAGAGEYLSQHYAAANDDEKRFVAELVKIVHDFKIKIDTSSVIKKAEMRL